jgi:hypothetical protein
MTDTMTSQNIDLSSLDTLYMGLTLREGYWIQFYMKLIAVIFLNNCYSQFYRPSCKLVQ